MLHWPNSLSSSPKNVSPLLKSKFKLQIVNELILPVWTVALLSHRINGLG